MGCLILGECKEGVVEVKSLKDVETYYSRYLGDRKEFDAILTELNKAGSKVYIINTHWSIFLLVIVVSIIQSDSISYQGRIYEHVHKYQMSVMRHEGCRIGYMQHRIVWDGTINNNIIALIMSEDKVPEIWQEMVRRTYPQICMCPMGEKRTTGKTEGMTLDQALKACNTGAMWEVYEPTPLTREYLIKEGYIDE